MNRAENLNAPSLNGWIIAAGFGLLAFMVAKIVGGFDYTPAGFFGGVVLAVSGLIIGMPWGGSVPTPVVEAHEDEAAPAAVAVPAAAVAEVAVAGEGSKPAALAAPRGGVADDLKQLEGVGPAMEKLCHELGIYHFDQIASWGAAEVAWMDANLKGFKGRVTRDKWVAQAKLIGEVGMEEFQRRAKTNDY